MIDFLKQRKIIIIIGILVIILVGWKIYDSRSFENLNSEDILVSDIKDNVKSDSKNKNDKEFNEEKVEEENFMAVHVTGEVKNPSVVRVKEGSRIEDIIKAAGGLTENADITDVNLAFVVEDGMKIRIPSNDNEDSKKNNSGEEVDEKEKNQIESKNNEYITQDSGKGVIVSNESNELSSSIVNINTASQTELEELPGIGPSISSRIIEYRNQKGNFKKIEDVKNVTGIGDSKFEKIKDLIKVK